MKVTVIPIVIGALETILKGLEMGQEELEIRGRAENIQTTTLLRYWVESWRLKKICCHSDTSEIQCAKAGVKNS